MDKCARCPSHPTAHIFSICCHGELINHIIMGKIVVELALLVGTHYVPFHEPLEIVMFTF